MASCTTTFPHPVQLAQYASPIGRMTLAASPDGLVGAWFVGQKYEPSFLPQLPEDEEATHCLALATSWLDCYFGKAEPDQFPALPLAPSGSPFRQTIWRLLKSIPYGTTTTYGALAARAAEQLGKSHLSAQAVGGAVGHNPLSIFLPCHRVVAADGRLTGYAGGLDRKVWLLRHEGLAITPDGTSLCR